MAKTVDSAKLQEMLASEDSESVALLDVREPEEVEHCRIEGSIHIALGELPESYRQLDPNQTLVVYCHHGPRGLMATRWLESKGFREVYNLEGGIDLWSLMVDSTVARY